MPLHEFGSPGGFVGVGVGEAVAVGVAVGVAEPVGVAVGVAVGVPPPKLNARDVHALGTSCALGLEVGAVGATASFLS